MVRQYLRSLGVLAVVALPVATAAQDPPAPAPARHRLVHRMDRGQVATIEQITTKVLQYRFRRVEGGEGPEGEVKTEVEHAERRLHTDTVREARDGRPTRLDRHVQVHTTASEIRPSAQRTAEQKPLHGRTLRLALEGDGPQARWRATTAADERVPGAEADPPPVPALCGFLPAAPVAEGDSWALDQAAVNGVLGTDWQARKVRETRATLAAVVTDGGRRLARIEVRLSWIAIVAEVMHLEASIAGPMVLDLDAARFVRADLSGTLTITTGPEARARGAADTKVEGTLAMRWRFAYPEKRE